MSEPERKSSVTVRIAGEEHTIRANAEPDYTRSCARYVDDRIQAREKLDRLRRESASRATNVAGRLEGEL